MALQEEFEKQGNWLFRYRGILPLIVLLAGLVLFLLTKLYPGAFFPGGFSGGTYYELACLLISLLGLFIRIYTVGHTPVNTSGRNVKKQVAGKVNTTGSYSLVRHPLYVGNFFMWLGPTLLTGQIWFVLIICLVFWLYYERIMFAEEQFLRAKFGTPYLEWASKVPAFVPRLNGFVKPDLPFSWRKVVKKEKNGFAAVFLVFFLFDMAGELILRGRDFNYVIAGGLAFSALSYVVVKILKSRTSVLNEPGR